MNTKGSGPNDFWHSDDLSELIEGMKNDALEQAKKETEKRRRKAKREYKKETLQKGNLGKQIKINKTNCLSRKKDNDWKMEKRRSRAPRSSSTDVESRPRPTYGRQQERQRNAEARLRRRRRDDGKRFWTGRPKPRSGRRNRRGWGGTKRHGRNADRKGKGGNPDGKDPRKTVSREEARE